MSIICRSVPFIFILRLNIVKFIYTFTVIAGNIGLSIQCDNMNSKIILAIGVAVVVVAAGIGAAVILNNKDDGYYSSNSDCRLQILGNADENDYLDSKDIDKINDMIEAGEYSQMADANNDDVVDSKDTEMVQSIIDLKDSNSGKDAADKEKMDVYYITVNGAIQTATFPVSKIICANTQRALDIAINIGVDDMIVATNDYVNKYATDVDSTYMYRAFKDLPSIGDRKTPDLEQVTKIDADAIYAGTTKYYMTNVDASATSYGGKTILRLASWENGGYANGALMLGFFTDADEDAQDFVKWMDDLDSEIQDKLADIENKSDIKVISMSSATWFGAQSDGVSTAISALGITNVGNNIITDTSKTGGSATTYKEDIVAQNPQYLILSPYLYLNQTSEEIATKYSGYDFSNIAACDAVKNSNIYMTSYEVPFVLQTLIVAGILFPDTFSSDYVDGYLQEYLDDYCNLDGTGYEYNADTFYYHPSTE